MWWEKVGGAKVLGMTEARRWNGLMVGIHDLDQGQRVSQW